MQDVTTKDFDKLLADLPAAIGKLWPRKLALFQHSPQHPSLRYHQLKDTGKTFPQPTWTISLNMQYRAAHTVDADVRIWYWIGSHDQADKKFGKR